MKGDEMIRFFLAFLLLSVSFSASAHDMENTIGRCAATCVRSLDDPSASVVRQCLDVERVAGEIERPTQEIEQFLIAKAREHRPRYPHLWIQVRSVQPLGDNLFDVEGRVIANLVLRPSYTAVVRVQGRSCQLLSGSVIVLFRSRSLTDSLLEHMSPAR